MSAQEARAKLQSLANPVVAASAARFYKQAHIAHDVFLGVRAATLRRLAKEFRRLPLTEVEVLLHSGCHEERSLALLILCLHVHRASEATQKEVYDFYLANTRHIDNWDLVDVSAPAVVGGYLIDRKRKPLYQLAKSANLWERRIAVVATQHFIRQQDFDDTLKLSILLLQDDEDLIHKAVGWMLREVGKKHEATLEAFLQEHGANMPRTMLRYAVERFSPEKRRSFMTKSAVVRRSRLLR